MKSILIGNRNFPAKAMLSLLLAASGLASAKLPPPTPAQVAAQAEKKAKADAGAEKDKQALLASMDAKSTYWRSRAKSKGWKVSAPTPIAAPAVAVTAPANQSGPAGQPGGVMGSAAKAAPVTSEKAGNAPAR